MLIEWKCPHCLSLAKVWDPKQVDQILGTTEKVSFIMTCDTEESGCGRRSVVDFWTSVYASSHKIEETREDNQIDSPMPAKT